MNLTILVIGTGEWERYTKPCLQSIRDNVPSAGVLVVDNGSQYIDHGWSTVKSPEVLSYPQAINLGLEKIWQTDWICITNNDVLFHKNIDTQNLEKELLYGFWEYETGKRKWLSGWCLFASWGLIQKVGLFDESFAPMYYEDADYSIRAQDAGFWLSLQEREDWGIEHINRNSERLVLKKKYEKDMQRNLAYLKEKHGLR